MTPVELPRLDFLTGRVFIITTPEDYARVLQALARSDVSDFSGRSFISEKGAKVTVLCMPVGKPKEEGVGGGDYTLLLMVGVVLDWLPEWADAATSIYIWGRDLTLVKGR